ncbi:MULTISPECIES: hypothetical protein [unclassified Arthrobacter]|uniref:hypothetical protein n=1 Tax=unclassified Arthrobacter TaxID=235627 RepID=UPI00288357FA|nr:MULTISPECIES: hypothetical protein [unclassified Arthrobacter]
MSSCAFCDSTQPLTREHVFGQWVGRLGLDMSPVQYKAGPLNGLHRDMGRQPPYRQTVKNFCATCNNGWMSDLEGIAQRVLSPLILGEPGTINLEDQSAIAMWVHKTALTAMLISSDKQRDEGYGLPSSEYAGLYSRRDQLRPLEASRFWLGRYAGTDEFSAVRVTPVTMGMSGFPEPDLPHGYVMTIVLGQLLLQGLRITTPDVDFPVRSDLELPQLWPSREILSWPAGQPCDETGFLQFADGRVLSPALKHLELHPWSPAVNVAKSVIVGDRVQVPAVCGKHVFHYPVALLREATRGRFYAFVTRCDCKLTYLMQTEPDGTHCKAVEEVNGATEIYEDMPGDEHVMSDRAGVFVFKSLLKEGTPAIGATEAGN